ncbi:hypothetical protein BJX99DRAFT_255577 [Aspergillus californicus]
MASASDTTPLLADSEYYENNDATLEHPKTPYLGQTVVLTILSTAFSILAFVTDLTVLSIDAAAPHGFYLYFMIRGGVRIMFIISTITLLISSLNLVRLKRFHRTLPTVLNIVIDAVIIFYSLAVGPAALIENFDQSSDWWLPDEGAAKVATAVIVLLAIGLISGIIVGGIHLVLFVLRCYAFVKTGSWQRQNWRIPSGEFKVEFSIKFQRQEEERQVGDQSRVPEV